MLEKPKGQSRMDNLEKLAILTQNEDKQNKKQHRKLNIWTTLTPSKISDEPRCSWSVSSSCLWWDTCHVTYIVNMCWTPLYASNTPPPSTYWSFVKKNHCPNSSKSNRKIEERGKLTILYTLIDMKYLTSTNIVKGFRTDLKSWSDKR